MTDPFGPAMATLPLSALVDSEVPDSVPRDRWKRPLILQPDGTLEPYTRISTAAGWLNDGHGLGIWKLRHAALSIGRHEDIAAMIAPLEYGDPALDEHIETACERSVEMVTARHWGTAIHSFTDHHPECRARAFVPERMAADVLSYDQALAAAGLVLMESELFVVNDRLKVAGTLDGLYLDTDTGFHVVGDKKTGTLKPLALSCQLAMYHGGRCYDPTNGVRTPLSTQLDDWNALGIHIPKDGGSTELHRIDLEQARADAELAMRVGARRRAEKEILQPW